MRDIKDIKLGEGDELLALRDEERYHNGPGGFYLGNQGNGESPVHIRHKYLYSPLVSPEAPSSTFIEHLLCAEYRGASISSFSWYSTSVLCWARDVEVNQTECLGLANKPTSK